MGIIKYLLPPAGQNLFEKRFRHLQKLFINKKFLRMFHGSRVMRKAQCAMRLPPLAAGGYLGTSFLNNSNRF
jgi:hypothetical protein